MNYENKFSKLFLPIKSDEDRMTPKHRTKSPSKQSMIFQLDSFSPTKLDHVEIDPLFLLCSPTLSSPLNKSPIKRKIPQKCTICFPFETEMSDFYPHPIDWSSSDTIAICNSNKIHLFPSKLSISSSSVISFPKNVSKSLKFSEDGSKINVGFINGKIKIVDLYALKTINNVMFFEENDFCQSVSCIDTHNNVTMAAFSNGSIGIFDERIPNVPLIGLIKAHDDSITISINRLNPNIFASTGNENTVKIWDFRNFDVSGKCQNLLTYNEHLAAIRGLAWSPFDSNIIATGGGMADRKLNVWNITNGETIKSVSVGSQICNIFWNKEYKEILITCGNMSNNITIWNDSTLKQVAEINNHSDRILYASMSPDNNQLVTITPKDPIRIWNVFQKKCQSPNIR